MAFPSSIASMIVNSSWSRFHTTACTSSDALYDIKSVCVLVIVSVCVCGSIFLSPTLSPSFKHVTIIYYDKTCLIVIILHTMLHGVEIQKLYIMGNTHYLESFVMLHKNR